MDDKIFCKICGNEITTDTKFCPKCGQSVSSSIVNDKSEGIGNTAALKGAFYKTEDENKTKKKKIVVIATFLLLCLLSVICVIICLTKRGEGRYYLVSATDQENSTFIEIKDRTVIEKNMSNSTYSRVIIDSDGFKVDRKWIYDNDEKTIGRSGKYIFSMEDKNTWRLIDEDKEYGTKAYMDILDYLFIDDDGTLEIDLFFENKSLSGTYTLDGNIMNVDIPGRGSYVWILNGENIYKRVYKKQ